MAKPKIILTNHSIVRFMERTGCKERDRAEERLMRMYHRSHEVKLSPEKAARRIMNNSVSLNFKDTLFYEYRKFRMVIVEDHMVTFEEITFD